MIKHKANIKRTKISIHGCCRIVAAFSFITALTLAHSPAKAQTLEQSDFCQPGSFAEARQVRLGYPALSNIIRFAGATDAVFHISSLKAGEDANVKAEWRACSTEDCSDFGGRFWKKGPGIVESGKYLQLRLKPDEHDKRYKATLTYSPMITPDKKEKFESLKEEEKSFFLNRCTAEFKLTTAPQGCELAGKSAPYDICQSVAENGYPVRPKNLGENSCQRLFFIPQADRVQNKPLYSNIIQIQGPLNSLTYIKKPAPLGDVQVAAYWRACDTSDCSGLFEKKWNKKGGFAKTGQYLQLRVVPYASHDAYAIRLQHSPLFSERMIPYMQEYLNDIVDQVCTSGMDVQFRKKSDSGCTLGGKTVAEGQCISAYRPRFEWTEIVDFIPSCTDTNDVRYRGGCPVGDCDPQNTGGRAGVCAPIYSGLSGYFCNYSLSTCTRTESCVKQERCCTDGKLDGDVSYDMGFCPWGNSRTGTGRAR